MYSFTVDDPRAHAPDDVPVRAQSGRSALEDALQLINSAKAQRLENKAAIVFSEDHSGTFLNVLRKTSLVALYLTRM